MKKRLIIIVCIVVFVLLFVKFFPTLFWKIHAISTKHLQVKLDKGKNDLEYEYGQDLYQDVSQIQRDGYTIFYPTNIEGKLPIVVWGNGTGNTYVNYEPALKSLASYGFVVVGCEDDNMGDGQKLIEMAKYMISMEENSDFELYQHLDVSKIGVAGHSQGACGAVNAATKEDIFVSLFTTSLPKLEMCVDKDNMKFAYWKYDMAKIQIPYFGNTGTRFLDSLWISPLDAMNTNFDSIPTGVEAYVARQIHANHNIVNEYHASGYFNAWFCYTLKDDTKAAKVFVGENPELSYNSKRWKDFKSK